jgi:hypothetical protein
MGLNLLLEYKSLCDVDEGWSWADKTRRAIAGV